jgi:hypothetical protein
MNKQFGYQPGGYGAGGGSITFAIPMAAAGSDLTSNLAAGTRKAIWFFPFNCDIVEVFAGVGTVGTGSSIIVDCNIDGVSALSTRIYIEANQKTSLTASTQPVLSTTSATKGQELSWDIDSVAAVDTGKAITFYIKCNPK